jgi:hypothetical protein
MTVQLNLIALEWRDLPPHALIRQAALSVQRSGRDLVMMQKRLARAKELPLSRITGESASTSDDPPTHRRYADGAVSLR